MKFGIKGSGTGLARLPKSYQYSDGQPLEIVRAKTMYDNVNAKLADLPERVNAPNQSMIPQHALHHVFFAEQVESRKTLADWLTSCKNQRFANVIANRLWKQAMGTAVVEPVDNLTDEVFQNRPALLRFLGDSMASLKFDTKQFLRAVYYSKTYQSASTKHSAVDTVNLPQFRRMSAEQIWDSLMTLSIKDVDRPREVLPKLTNYLGLKDIYDSYDKLERMSSDEVMQTVLQTISRRESDESYPRHVFRMDARPGVNRRNLIYGELTGNELMRASYLLSPMPANHLLRDFGQSDREAVSNGNREIATSQLLQLMNGFAEKRILRDDSVLMQRLKQASDVDQKIRMAYQTVLARTPTAEEFEEWKTDFKNHPADATADMVWTILNSTEFLFIQ